MWKSFIKFPLQLGKRSAALQRRLDLDARLAPLRRKIDLEARSAALRRKLDLNGRIAALRHTLDLDVSSAALRRKLDLALWSVALRLMLKTIYCFIMKGKKSMTENINDTEFDKEKGTIMTEKQDMKMSGDLNADKLEDKQCEFIILDSPDLNTEKITDMEEEQDFFKNFGEIDFDLNEIKNITVLLDSLMDIGGIALIAEIVQHLMDSQRDPVKLTFIIGLKLYHFASENYSKEELLEKCTAFLEQCKKSTLEPKD